MLTRRAFGGLLGAATLAGCATTGARSPRALPAAEISAGLIDRVTVGLRPFRPAGFVVRAESLGAKRLVHNYGHGGGGITLSWGSSELAVDLAGPAGAAAVIGCGILGLTTARILQERGVRVTIYARDLPPHTTSNVAGGQWWPASVFEGEVDPAFMAQFEQAARRAHRRYQRMAGQRRYGVWWQDNWTLGGGPLPLRPPSLHDLAPRLALLGPGEHPFGDTYAQYHQTMMIEPGVHLDALMRDMREAGGQIVVRDFASVDQIAALPEPVVFNCTGLGARTLFADDGLAPVRGQLVVLHPQPQLNYNLLYRGAYAFPRPDGLVLGGTHQRGDFRLEPDPGDTDRILAINVRAFATLA